MTHDKSATKKKIILATILCINRDGLDATTIRSIAKEAGVNNAAINYHFGSKDNLIETAINTSLGEAFNKEEADELLNSTDYLPALQNYLKFSLKGMTGYPGLTRAHFHAPFVHDDYQSTPVLSLNRFMSKLAEAIKAKRPTLSDDDIKLYLIVIFNAILLPGILPQMYMEFADFDMADESNIGKYIDFIFQHLKL